MSEETSTNKDATNSGKRDDDQPPTLSGAGAKNSSTNNPTPPTTSTKQQPTIDISQSLPSSNNNTNISSSQSMLLPTYPSSPPISPSSSYRRASDSKFVINDTAPKWRFVNKAKKTEGYDSTAAGQIVKGELFVLCVSMICAYYMVSFCLFVGACTCCVLLLPAVVLKKLFSNIIYTHIHLLNIH